MRAMWLLFLNILLVIKKSTPLAGPRNRVFKGNVTNHAQMQKPGFKKASFLNQDFPNIGDDDIGISLAGVYP